MTVQQATEAPNINSDQLWLSLGGMQIADRLPQAGAILIDQSDTRQHAGATEENGVQNQLWQPNQRTHQRHIFRLDPWQPMGRQQQQW